MKHQSQPIFFSAGSLIALAIVSQAPADDRAAKFISGPGTYLFLAAGVGLPLLRDGQVGRDHAYRAVDSALTTLVLTEGLKAVTRVPRPDTGSHDSFPSEHASLSFAVATMEASFHPSESFYWYAGAAAISYSRVSLNRHRPIDVISGSALGFFTSRAELSMGHGILLTPWIGSSRTVGISINGSL